MTNDNEYSPDFVHLFSIVLGTHPYNTLPYSPLHFLS
jgi:hypothetical protein